MNTEEALQVAKACALLRLRVTSAWLSAPGQLENEKQLHDEATQLHIDISSLEERVLALRRHFSGRQAT